MHVFGYCLNHDKLKSKAWAYHNCLNHICYKNTQEQNTMIEIYLVWKPKIVSWIILSPTLEPIEGVFTWSTSRARSSQDTCLPSVRSSHCKQIPKGHNHGWSFPSASPRHFIRIKIQAYRVSNILNGPRRSKWPNFASLHIWFATSWLSLKFVSLSHVSMFLWILKIHVAFDVLCSCIYF